MSAGFSLFEPNCISGDAGTTQYYPPSGMPTSSQQISRVAYAFSVSGLGNSVVNEEQLIEFSSVPTSGTWTITFGGDTTAALDFDADAAAIDAALEALPSIGAGNISVTGDYTIGFSVVFIGTLGGANQAQVTVDTASGSLDATATVSTVQNGSTTTPSIVLKIQVSFDAPSSKGGDVANMTWFDLSSSTTNITGNTSGILGPIAICAPYYRVAYVVTAGSGGTVQVSLFGRKE